MNSEIILSAHQKKQHLIQYLQSLGQVLVAFSSGVDSTFLLKTAHEVLGEQAVAVTACSPLFPSHETEEARQFCKQEQIRQVLIDMDPFSIEGFRDNPPNRCYICKRSIFRQFCDTARTMNIPYIAEGTNADDLLDYRPGMKAISELGIKSPLLEAGLTKQEIRILSREAGLTTWSKPSYACLASRFVHGETITTEKLSMVGQAEQILMGLGFLKMRVRIHGEHNYLARIELDPEDMNRFMSPEIRGTVARSLHKLGFSYVSFDLDGYRTGSMNKVIE